MARYTYLTVFELLDAITGDKKYVASFMDNDIIKSALAQDNDLVTDLTEYALSGLHYMTFPLLFTIPQTQKMVLHTQVVGSLANKYFRVLPARAVSRSLIADFGFLHVHVIDYAFFVALPFPFLQEVDNYETNPLKGNIISASMYAKSITLQQQYYLGLFLGFPKSAFRELKLLLTFLGTFRQFDGKKDEFLAKLVEIFPKSFFDDPAFQALLPFFPYGKGVAKKDTTFVTKNLLEVLSNKLEDWGISVATTPGGSLYNTATTQTNITYKSPSAMGMSDSDKLINFIVYFLYNWDLMQSSAARAFQDIQKLLEMKIGVRSIWVHPHLTGKSVKAEAIKLNTFEDMVESSTYLYNNLFEGDLSDVVKEVASAATVDEIDDIFTNSGLTKADIAAFVGQGFSIDTATLQKSAQLDYYGKTIDYTKGYNSYLNKLRTKLVTAFATI